MGADSKIEWTDATVNFWWGCTKVGPGCDHCYAKTLVEGRLSGDFSQRVRSAASTWKQPLAWNRKAEREGVHYRVFCASLADVFDNQVPVEWRADLWWLINDTPQLDWLLLTKRPQNISRMLPADWGDGYPNVWLGTTVENQTEADRRIPHLLAVPAAVRFLSCEPLLGPVDLRQWIGSRPYIGASTYGGVDGFRRCDLSGSTGLLDWVICGGESGPGARPMHPDWARSLRDQCEAAGVAFHFKQWGEWAPSTPEDAKNNPRSGWQPLAGHLHVAKPQELHPDAGAAFIARIGKKAAGRLLDGRSWDQFPGGAA